MKKSALIGPIGAGCLAIFVFGGYVAKNDLSAGDAVKVVATLGEYKPDTSVERERMKNVIWNDARKKIVEIIEESSFGGYCVNAETKEQYTDENICFTGSYRDSNMLNNLTDGEPVVAEVVNILMPVRITWDDGQVKDYEYDMQYLYYTPHPNGIDYDGPIEKSFANLWGYPGFDD